MNDGTWEFTAKLMPPPPPPPGPKPKKPPPKPPPPPPFQPAYEIQFGVMEKGAEITTTFSRSRFPLTRAKNDHLICQARVWKHIMMIKVERKKAFLCREYRTDQQALLDHDRKPPGGV
jgi:hypothetical protein